MPTSKELTDEQEETYETLEPVSLPEDKSIDLRKLYEYLKNTGKKTTELTKEEWEQFVFTIESENA